MALFLAMLAGCQKSPLPGGGAVAAQKITVAYTLQPQSTLLHVAMVKGYFSGHGLDVRPLIFGYGKQALQSVVDRQADFATAAETPIMFSILNGSGIFVVANIEASSLNNGIVGRRDAGIADARDLKGKRIAYTPGTTSDFFLDSMLTANGLSRAQISPVALKPEQMQDALLANKLDAVSTWNYPLTQIKRRLGEAGTVLFDKHIYTETFNIASSRSFVGKNPGAVEKFLAALIEAERFVAQHPGEAQDIMSAAARVDRGLIQDTWSAFNYHVATDRTLLIALEDETRWAMKNGLTSQLEMPDYRRYIYHGSLRPIKPEAFGADR